MLQEEQSRSIPEEGSDLADQQQSGLQSTLPCVLLLQVGAGSGFEGGFYVPCAECDLHVACVTAAEGPLYLHLRTQLPRDWLGQVALQDPFFKRMS